jgi:hypothetical protein
MERAVGAGSERAEAEARVCETRLARGQGANAVCRVSGGPGLGYLSRSGDLADVIRLTTSFSTSVVEDALALFSFLSAAQQACVLLR